MSKHTPGPWSIVDWDRNGNNKIFNTREKGWVKIFNTELREEVLSDVNVETPEGEANARLIAAAPDMLAALKTIAGYKCEWRDKSAIWLQEVAAKVIEQLEHADK